MPFMRILSRKSFSQLSISLLNDVSKWIKEKDIKVGRDC